MADNTNVGGYVVAGAGDQRNAKDSDANDAQRYEEGQANSHLANDSSMVHPQGTMYHI